MLRLIESPETLFIFRTVAFIISGLVLAVLVWLAWREPGKRKQWLEWLPPFVLLAAANGLGAWGSFRLLVAVAESEGLLLYFAASELAETTGLAWLVWVILRRPWGGWALLSWGPPAFELAFIVYRGTATDYPPLGLHSAVVDR